MITKYFTKYLVAKIEVNLELHYKKNLINTILSKDYNYIASYHTGQLMNRLTSDIKCIEETIISILPKILSLLVKLIVVISLLLYINKNFALVFLVGGIFVFLIVNVLKVKIKKMHKLVQVADDSFRSFIQEVLENLLVIKIYKAKNIVNDNIDKLQDNYKSSFMKKKKITIHGNTRFSAVMDLAYFYGIVWSAYNLYTGLISIGTLTLIIQLINQIQAPVAEISMSFQKIFSMFGSVERIIEIENLKDEQIEIDNIDVKDIYGKLSCIDIRDLTFGYGSRIIFEKANFRINKGDILAVYGESGIGKSTLLKLILGVTENNNSIFLNLNDGTSLNINSSYSKLFAYVPQGKFILSGSIKENIMFANKNVSEENIKEVIKLVKLDSLIKDLEKGIDTFIGENGFGLSEGQIQRIQIARAIISGCPILIFDEITSALDEKTEEEILNNIKELTDRTCIIVTHRQAVSKICDKKIVVRGKKILLDK